MKKKYSEREQKLMALLPANGAKVTTSVLASKLYGKALNARTIINGRLTGLMEKVRVNREAFRIRKSERNGPHPISYWRECL